MSGSTPDVTNLVEKLAKSGDLRIIQIINRQLPVWPAELQRCTDLRSMYASFSPDLSHGISTDKFCFVLLRVLMYTNINVIPEWAAAFHHLEMLYVMHHSLHERDQTLTLYFVNEQEH